MIDFITIDAVMKILNDHEAAIKRQFTEISKDLDPIEYNRILAFHEGRKSIIQHLIYEFDDIKLPPKI